MMTDKNDYIPRLFLEAMSELIAAYLYASTPSYQFSRMREGLELAKARLDKINPPVALPDANELYDIYQIHLKSSVTRSFTNAVVLYTVIVAIVVLIDDKDQALELVEMLNISGLTFGNYFKNAVITEMVK